jgi:hypothetical protein
VGIITSTENKENKMKKIYQVRHMEQMLLLAKRMKRNSKTLSELEVAVELIERYEDLLEFVQDSK